MHAHGADPIHDQADAAAAGPGVAQERHTKNTGAPTKWHCEHWNGDWAAEEAPRHHDLDDLAGTWVDDPEFDRAIGRWTRSTRSYGAEDRAGYQLLPRLLRRRPGGAGPRAVGRAGRPAIRDAGRTARRFPVRHQGGRRTSASCSAFSEGTREHLSLNEGGAAPGRSVHERWRYDAWRPAEISNRLPFHRRRSCRTSGRRPVGIDRHSLNSPCSRFDVGAEVHFVGRAAGDTTSRMRA